MTELLYSGEIPGVDEFIRLRGDAGLTPNEPDAATRGLAGTFCAVCVRDGDRLVGMGRVTGDGGCHFQVVDIAVHPDYQRRGIGRGVMSRLMTELRERAPRTAYVSLIADGDASKLYEQFGFRPTAPESIGMAQRL